MRSDRERRSSACLAARGSAGGGAGTAVADPGDGTSAVTNPATGTAGAGAAFADPGGGTPAGAGAAVAPRRRLDRERCHAALLAAAFDLTRTRGPDAYSFSDIAARAGVSRRTVFNHFPTRESLTLEMCGHVLAAAVDRIEVTLARDSPMNKDEFFASLTSALLAADLPAAAADITTVVGTDASPAKQNAILRLVLERVNQIFADHARRAFPAVSDFAIALLVSQITSGIVTASTYWHETYRPTDWPGHVRLLVAGIATGHPASPAH
ncbi:TetR/AcrR family transcriptional regulator [Rarobacter incanus]|uniref:TetR family transcriptional regulator n=1 Tax=Rarobacter incanus TaxID=153494 RepID=A0A542SNG5_9MICO|nr:TetR/AcrR family transcriptional regulator [Rarobacter incanus]TQK76171.1 TetR family transcriptional regulator [Rarobacter incanus]